MIPRNSRAHRRHLPRLTRMGSFKKYTILPALGFILACLLLAGVLSISTWQNLDRQQQFMKTFLLQQGETLIRSFEAGARTAMMGPRSGDLDTLVQETARANDIAYIVVRDDQGRATASSTTNLNLKNLARPHDVLTSDTPLTRSLTDSSGQDIYELAKEFNPLAKMPESQNWTCENGNCGGTMGRKMMDQGTPQQNMMRRYQNWCGVSAAQRDGEFRQVIYLGLYTTQFDAARQKDFRHSLMMLGLLFLLSSGGLYALFLSHQSQVTKATLENMELYTDNVVNSMPEGLISIDTKNKIVSANSTALKLFAIPPAQIVGKTFQQLLPQGGSPPELESEEEFIDRPLTVTGRDGETIPLKLSASKLHDREGTLQGKVLILRDQREIKAMEEALERSRRHAALGQMAAGVAHEIRNPLGTLRGFAQYFAKHNRQDPTAQEYAELMVSEVDRLNRTISALLQFSRPREPEFSQVELNQLAQRSLTFIESEAESQGVQVKLATGAAEVNLMADPDLLQQVLLNLLQNSLAATSAGDTIEIGVAPQARHIHIWVRDSGRGLAGETQEKMFDPFFTTRKDGTGLGLAVVQQIIEQHNGHIEVTSKAGEGTCMTMILPLTKEHL